VKDLQKEKASPHMKAKEQAQLMHQLHAQAQHVTAQSSTQALPQMVPLSAPAGGVALALHTATEATHDPGVLPPGPRPSPPRGQRRSRSVHAVRLRDYLSAFIS
jgi:hypothetical protein